MESWHLYSIPSEAILDKFIEYFIERKVCLIQETVIQLVREECGLGCSPDIFTTNASESINAVLKCKVHY